MKVRSIQFKFLITVISAILVIAVFVGGFSIYEVNNYVQQHTKEFIDITCSNEAAQVNDIFGDIETAVRIMESYVLSLFERSTDIMNRENQQEFLRLAGEMFADVAANTDGAVAYYLRFDPAISDSKTGMFYSKLNGGDKYIALEPTDLFLYDKEDTEHVGWFWQPYEAGQPIWLAPYYNQNNDILMISFVIPLYVENQFIGVVGMDFDYTVLTERVHQIRVFDDGFALLELNDTVIHTGSETSNTDHSHETHEDYLQTSEELTNGMKLVLFASYQDIKQTSHKIAYKILLAVLLLTLIFCCIVFWIVKKVVKPLKSLTEAATNISGCNYDITIEHSNIYEIQLLSTTFENMLINLREHEKFQHLLAYRDSLTGLRNTTSFKEYVINFNKTIKGKESSFGIVVLDINDLKRINDTYGHTAGNNLIVTASHIISDIFKRSPVFRIGGDEFLVILQNRDLEDRDALFAKFETECANTSVEIDNACFPISVAKGFSLFDPATDTQFSDVFNRADDEMYKNKKDMKQESV